MKIENGGPRCLSGKEKIMVKNYGFDVMVDDNWDKINAAIQRLKTDNPYDIQQFCLDIALVDTFPDIEKKCFTEKDIDKIKIIAYETCEPIIVFTNMIGLIIRDKYFEENSII